MCQSLSNSISFAMMIIAPNVISRKLFGLAKKSPKNFQNSNRRSSSSYSIDKRLVLW